MKLTSLYFFPSLVCSIQPPTNTTKPTKPIKPTTTKKKTGHPRFFLGTDSAPHPSHKKEGPDSCAGVFTTPLVLPYLATILESFGALDRLRGFACDFGRAFYEVKNEKWVGEVKLVREEWNTPQKYSFGGEGIVGEKGDVVPFMAGKPLGWKIASIN